MFSRCSALARPTGWSRLAVSSSTLTNEQPSKSAPVEPLVEEVEDREQPLLGGRAALAGLGLDPAVRPDLLALLRGTRARARPSTGSAGRASPSRRRPARSPRRSRRRGCPGGRRARTRCRGSGRGRGSAATAFTLRTGQTCLPPRLPAPAVCYALGHERRDPLLPRLKRLRRPGRESRGRAEGARIRRNDPAGRSGQFDVLEDGSSSSPSRSVHRSRSRAKCLRSCSPDRGSPAAAADSLSHGDFVKRADAVCSAYTSQTKADLRPRSYTQIVAYVDKTLPLYEAALRKLEALKPPSSDAAAVQRGSRPTGASRKSCGPRRGRAAARLPGVTAAASRAQLAGSESRQAAAELGMHVCATARRTISAL